MGQRDLKSANRAVMCQSEFVVKLSWVEHAFRRAVEISSVVSRLQPQR